MKEQSKGRYIIFEGTDGSGKTTLLNMVAQAIPDPHKMVVTKEPGTPHIQLCIDIREEILNASAAGRDPEFYAYLFAADTKLHMEKVVKPALANDQWVISDRSVMSDYAYRPRDGGAIREDNFKNFMRQHPVVFFIDTHPDICATRMKERDDANEFEKAHVIGKVKELNQSYKYHSHKKFDEQANKYSWTQGFWHEINNDGPAIIAFTQIMCHIVAHFPEYYYLIELK